jgi:hypothetical protein
MPHLLGLEPDREHIRRAQSVIQPFQVDHSLGNGDRMSDVYICDAGVQQPIYSIHDQAFASCVGESLGAVLEAKVGYKVSSIGIWRDARRRQGRIEDLVGTRFEYGIESLMRRGWDRYESGEETNPDEMTKPDDLDSEMDAHDNREPDLEHFRVDTEWNSEKLLASIESALSAGLGVVFGTGVQDAYQSYAPHGSADERIIGTDWLGDGPGHAQRIFTYRKLPGGEKQYGVQGSWTEFWGGMTTLTGQWQRGCCWVKADVLLLAWDIHVLKLKKV